MVVARGGGGVSIYLLIAEAHLPSSVARDVHAAEENAGIVGRREDGVRSGVGAVTARRSSQLILNVLVILLVDDIVDAVAVNQQVLLSKRNDEYQSILYRSIGFSMYSRIHVLVVFIDGINSGIWLIDLSIYLYGYGLGL